MGDDIIEEEIELHLVDTTQLVEEAKKLKEAQRIKKANDKIQKQLTFSKPSPFIQAGPREALPLRESRAQTRVGAVKSAQTGNEFTKMQKRLKELEKKQKKALKKFDDFQDKYLDKIDTAKSFLSAGSLEGGALSVFSGVASRFGPIGIAITAIVATIIPGYFEQYERGGIFSTKLAITEREKNIADIDYVVDVRSGTKFLTSDLRMAQKAPDTSNTLNLRYEHIRYTSQELGK